jgi:hypothetical protein
MQQPLRGMHTQASACHQRLMWRACPWWLQDLANKHCSELGMQTVPSLNIAYTAEQGYVTADVAKAQNLTTLSLSGTKFRQMLRG